jgi:ABC-type phosphate transport system ATPase subunit
VTARTKIHVRGLKVCYGAKEVLSGIDLDVYENRVVGLMGPSASG